MSFHGSYRPQDVEFLLKPIPVTLIDDLHNKERLIQSGQRHYSEMLTPEKLPSARYRMLFFEAHAMNRARMAADCLRLAACILRARGPRPTLVSLARAGTPVGVILAHLLRDLTGADIAHYSVSIIRDRGIDANALEAILARGVRPESIVFVDGWTGKGVIGAELQRAVAAFNARHGTAVPSELYVLTDLSGTAHGAASTDDYLIPSSLLNATISGLISRSVLNEAIGPRDFHGCLHYTEFAEHDLSVWFVDDILACARDLARTLCLADVQPADVSIVASAAAVFLKAEMTRSGISDRNLIKPGIGEATRVLMRRLPDRLLVRDPGQDSVRHLLALAEEKDVPVEVRPDMPFNAVSLIRSALDA